MEPFDIIIHELGGLKRLITLLAQTGSKPMLSPKEAALYLGISVSTLYKHTSTNAIAYYKPNGKLISFRKQDLDAWLESKRIPTDKELGA